MIITKEEETVLKELRETLREYIANCCPERGDLENTKLINIMGRLHARYGKVLLLTPGKGNVNRPAMWKNP